LFYSYLLFSPGLTTICRYYLATSRELKRLDAVSRSPIFAWFSESLAGLSTIRAFHQQDIFAAINHNRIDRNQMCYLPSISVNRWLAVRLEFVGAIIIFAVALFSMSALITTGVDAGLVGLVLSYALNTTSSLVRFGFLSLLSILIKLTMLELGREICERSRTEHR
jgi:ABC-type multidrug transport system fused ATPase/permease subunit